MRRKPRSPAELAAAIDRARELIAAGEKVVWSLKQVGISQSVYYNSGAERRPTLPRSMVPRLYEQAAALVRDGVRPFDACRQVGLPLMTYYNRRWREQHVAVQPEGGRASA